MAKSIICIISIVLFCYACKKETGVAGQAGPAGNNGLNGSTLDTGTITGNLVVYNEFSWAMSDSSNVKVSVQSNGTTVSTSSDRSGNYYFHGLPSGTYNLTYEKANYGTMKVFGVSHSPGSNLNTTVPEVYVLQNPVKTAIDSVSAYFNGQYINLTIYLDTSSLSYSQYAYNFALLIGTDPNPSQANSTVTTSEYFIPNGQGAYSYVVVKDNLWQYNLGNGPYYIGIGTFNRNLHAYKNPYSFFDAGFGGYYVDPSSGKYVYPNLKLSPNIIKVQ
jgi:Carboxypeptidase regulatory-like domain